jgi:hypothetical protein
LSHAARKNSGQGRLAEAAWEMNNIRNRFPNQRTNIDRIYNTALRGVASEGKRRQARRKSPSRLGRVNLHVQKIAHRFKKPVISRRVVSSVHQLGNILPRNVLEKIVREVKRFSPSRRV